MNRSFALATLAYLVPTFALGYSWHFWLFPRLYESLAIYNRPAPIIPLGFASMVVQGLVMAYLYPHYHSADRSVWRGVRFGLVMGALLFSVSTMANAAKMLVTDLGAWFAVQAAFHVVQFAAAGALIALAYRRRPATAPAALTT